MSRPSIYPWDRWLKMGNSLEIVRGKDFHCQTYAMAIRLRQEASKRSRRLRMAVLGDVITIKVLRRKSNV